MKKKYALASLAVVLVSCCGCFVAAAVFGRQIQQEKLAEGRAACSPPSVFRLRQGRWAESVDVSDYECVRPPAPARASSPASTSTAVPPQIAQASLPEPPSEPLVQPDTSADLERARGLEVVAYAAQVVDERYTDVVEYDARLALALGALDGLPAAFQEENARAIRSTRTALARRRARIARDVARAREAAAEAERIATEYEAARLAREARARADQVADDQRCGTTVPALSPWDGELVGAARYMSRSAHDPDSIEVERCTNPIRLPGRCWVSTCDVRGRNALGAMVLNRVQFSVGARGSILSASTDR